uniref:DDE-1 domain-containing protein n=1 Tax=Heterorhabditis bacteriophora TaxID=37862 RepID=A0A1I7WX53_HETBA
MPAKRRSGTTAPVYHTLLKKKKEKNDKSESTANYLVQQWYAINCPLFYLGLLVQVKHLKNKGMTWFFGKILNLYSFDDAAQRDALEMMQIRWEELTTDMTTLHEHDDFMSALGLEVDRDDLNGTSKSSGSGNYEELMMHRKLCVFLILIRILSGDLFLKYIFSGYLCTVIFYSCEFRLNITDLM